MGQRHSSCDSVPASLFANYHLRLQQLLGAFLDAILPRYFLLQSHSRVNLSHPQNAFPLPPSGLVSTRFLPPRFLLLQIDPSHHELLGTPNKADTCKPKEGPTCSKQQRSALNSSMRYLSLELHTWEDLLLLKPSSLDVCDTATDPFNSCVVGDCSFWLPRVCDVSLCFSDIASSLQSCFAFRKYYAFW